jgi:hypothetical protein
MTRFGTSLASSPKEPARIVDEVGRNQPGSKGRRGEDDTTMAPGGDLGRTRPNL